MAKKIIKEEVKQNPSDAMAAEDAKKVRAAGQWQKATYAELVQHEKDGNLLGHDPETGMVLLKEDKNA